MERAARNVLICQFFFYVGLAISIAIKPHGLSTNDGISYYGIYRETFFPYAIGLLGAAYFMLQAAQEVPVGERELRLSLKTYAPLVIGIVITPYAAGRWMADLHTTCGATLFSLQLVLSFWLMWRVRYAWWSVVLTLLELTAGIASALYLSPAHGFLLQSQVIFQVAFALLLTASLQSLEPTHAVTAKA